MEHTEIALWLMSFAVGILIGLTSMGGAALMTPFLILVIGVRPLLAVGTDLAYSAVTKIIGALMHWRQCTVDVRTALYLGCGSIPGAAAGVSVLAHLRESGVDIDQWLRRAIGVVLMAVSVVLLVRTLRVRAENKSLPYLLVKYRTHCIIAWGATVGFAVGMTSVGSGSLIVPLLLMLYPATPALMVGTDVFHAALLVAFSALLHLGANHVDLHLLPSLLAGSVPGVLLGSYLAPRLPARTLRLGLGLVLLTTGVKLL